MGIRLLCSALLLSAAALSPALAAVMTAHSTGVIYNVNSDDHKMFGEGVSVGTTYSMTTSFDYSGMEILGISPSDFYYMVGGSGPWTATITLNGVTQVLAKTGGINAFVANGTSRNVGELDQIHASVSSFDGITSMSMHHGVASPTTPFIGPVAELGAERTVTVSPEERLNSFYNNSNFIWFDLDTQLGTSLWMKVHTFSVNTDEPASVPEPGTLMLFGLGIAVAVASRRRVTRQ